MCVLYARLPHTHTHTLDIIFRPFLSFYFRCVSVRGKKRGGESRRAGGICKINTNITHRYVLQPDIIPTHACGFCICFYRFCLILFFVVLEFYSNPSRPLSPRPFLRFRLLQYFGLTLSETCRTFRFHMQLKYLHLT